MTKHPADTLLRSLAKHAQKLIAEEARWQRQMQDPHGISEELDKLAQAPYAEMFEGLALWASMGLLEAFGGHTIDPNKCGACGTPHRYYGGHPDIGEPKFCLRCLKFYHKAWR